MQLVANSIPDCDCDASLHIILCIGVLDPVSILRPFCVLNFDSITWNVCTRIRPHKCTAPHFKSSFESLPYHGVTAWFFE